MSTATLDPPAPIMPPLTELPNADLIRDEPEAPILLLDCDPELLPADWFREHIVIPLPEDPGFFDLTPLHGRDVIIWPRNSKFSKAAAKYVHDQASARVLKPKKELAAECGPLEALEAGWDDARLADYLAACGVRQAPTGDEPPPHTEAGPEYDAAGEAPSEAGAPYQPLGTDHGRNYYISRGTRQVVEISASHHTSGALLHLAPLQHWELNYPGTKGANWNMAANALLRQCERAGIYDAGRVRGRGAWHDAGRVVLHLGDRLIVDGREVELADLTTDYIYEAAPILRFGRAKPLRAAEAVKLRDLCNALNWERPESGTLLAGWLVIAPICGALNFRPHICLTGQSGSGKSWCYEHLIATVLGDAALALASKTTEAGIRRALGSDARPVLLDEFEARDQRTTDAAQAVLDLCRYMSSETSATIAKGNARGGTDYFRPRSCVLLSSIGVITKEYADKNRFTNLTLLKDNSAERAQKFATLQAMQIATLTPEFVAGLQARTVSKIPQIRADAKIFAAAASNMFGVQRMGDQIGPLLAGAYSLTSSNPVTLEAATAWILGQQWLEEKSTLDDQDGDSCLAHIMEHQILAETSHGPKHRAVGELARIAMGRGAQDEVVSADVAADTLRRHGMMMKWHEEKWFLLIGNRHSGMAKILAGTGWSRNWGRRLLTCPHITAWHIPMRFTPGPSTERASAVMMEG